MDMNKWKEYENKEKAIRKNYKKQRLVAFLIWLLVIAVIFAVLILLKDILGVQLFFMSLFFSFAISAFVLCKKIADLFKGEKQQVDLLEQEEPFGRFKV